MKMNSQQTTTVTLGMNRIRPAAVAGSWYPKEPKILESYIDNLLESANANPKQLSIRALIAPHAGYQYSGATAADVYRALRGLSYQRVLILGPAHYCSFHGLSIDAVDAYDTPLGRIPLDHAIITALRPSKLVHFDSQASRREHSIEMQLPFLQRVLAPGWKLLPILVGALHDEDYAKIAELLIPLISKNTLLIASSDFTHFGAHFGYQPFPIDATIASRLEILDKGALAPILAKDADAILKYKQQTGITVCGISPISILLRLLPKEVIGSLQTYTTSGKLTGDYSHSVSYMSVLFWDQISS